MYVRELSLVNTGLLDKFAAGLAKALKRNRTLEKVNVESNFITGEGAVSFWIKFKLAVLRVTPLGCPITEAFFFRFLMFLHNFFEYRKTFFLFFSFCLSKRQLFEVQLKCGTCFIDRQFFASVGENKQKHQIFYGFSVI